MISILIADDHPVVRAGLRAVFESHEDFTVVAEAPSAEEAVKRASEGDVDLVTMDLRFADGGMSGVQAIRAIRAHGDHPRILVLTNYDDDSEILAAVEAGAQGYLLKDSAPADLTSAVQRAASGEVVLAPVVAGKLLSEMRKDRITLTGRERDVLNALDRGLSNREISEELFLSPTTIKTHLARLYGKLGVSSRTAALARAREEGLLD